MAGNPVRRLMYIAIWAAATAALLLAARSELRRLEQGGLFALAMPWETPPLPTEYADAAASARRLAGPAMLFLAVVAFAAPTVLRRLASRRLRLSAEHWILLALFVLAMLGDMGSTIWFFHRRGMDCEIHPAIRLFGYAYGRTLGPVFGKLLQGIGVVALGLAFPRLFRPLLIAATVLYALACVYNMAVLWW